MVNSLHDMWFALVGWVGEHPEIAAGALLVSSPFVATGLF